MAEDLQILYKSMMTLPEGTGILEAEFREKRQYIVMGTIYIDARIYILSIV
jgi:hypothetical protein